MNALLVAVLGVSAMAALGWYNRQRARDRLLANYAQVAEQLGANYVDPTHPNGAPSINGTFRDQRFSIFSLQKVGPDTKPVSMVHLELEGVQGSLRFIPAPSMENSVRPTPNWTTGDLNFDRKVLVWGEEVRVRAVLTMEGRQIISSFIAEGGLVTEGKLILELPEARSNPLSFPTILDRLAEMLAMFSLGQRENADRIKSNFNDPVLQIRRDNLEALAKGGFAWGPALTPLLNDPDIPLRIRAAELGGEDGLLKDLLNDPTCKYRLEAANALGKMVGKGLPRAAMTLREIGAQLATDSDRHIQLACVNATTGLPRSEGLKILELARGTSPGPVVTQAIVRAAGKLGSWGKLTSEAKLPTDHAAVVAVAEGLLLDLLDHEDGEVRSAVINELARVGSAKALVMLARLKDLEAARQAVESIHVRLNAAKDEKAKEERAKEEKAKGERARKLLPAPAVVAPEVPVSPPPPLHDMDLE